jgi:hypothetical protein
VSVFGSGGMVLHTYVLRVQYTYGVVLVFWFWWVIVLGVTYVLGVQYSCVIVSVSCSHYLIGLLYYDLLAKVCIL